ncbi:hypothetical protein A2483_04965 [Candidatus Peregrinibacteria bacterium RIFOXYC2_FULL_33_13]|nr:MAG: hypothetical protein UR27_C0002G0056 [Candidatus Peregrinibacteria bacterium GW2011_GWA2_33_10]KKP41071.1 MAG: hypothetical protein UR30_C0002G0105 [Candidatus Peregrinibacteria bacterium GW2011_GWC2_33_13]OGJ54263.1 MAG: hypothetical protein A2483_04965 [Candidatus Peregrinibacteria bacterium RIFOXYC2_FULL_33_13]
MKKFFILLFCILISQLAGIIGSIFTIPNINDWYNLLSKPAFTPPSWLFGPAWIVLYLLMGFALYLIIVTDIKKNFFDRIIDFVLRIKDDDKSAAYSFFAIQLILNSLWSILFFGLHNPLYALIEIVFLWLAIFMTIYYFSKHNILAASLLIPYIVWVSFAVYLNAGIYFLNRISF